MWKNRWFSYTYYCTCLINNLNRPNGSGQSKRPVRVDRPTECAFGERPNQPASERSSSRGGVKGHDRIGRHVTSLIGSRRRESTPGLQASTSPFTRGCRWRQVPLGDGRDRAEDYASGNIPHAVVSIVAMLSGRRMFRTISLIPSSLANEIVAWFFHF